MRVRNRATPVSIADRMACAQGDHSWAEAPRGRANKHAALLAAARQCRWCRLVEGRDLGDHRWFPLAECFQRDLRAVKRLWPRETFVGPTPHGPITSCPFKHCAASSEDQPCGGGGVVSTLEGIH